MDYKNQIFNCLKKGLSHNKESAWIEFKVFCCFYITYHIFLLIYFFVIPYNYVDEILDIGLIFPMLISFYFMLVLVSCFIRCLKQKVTNVFFIIPTRIIKFVICFILSIFIVYYIQQTGHTLYLTATTFETKNKQEKYRKNYETQKKIKENEILLEQQQIEDQFNEISYIQGYMVVNVDEAPTYSIPSGVNNPYDEEELTYFFANEYDDHWDFNSLIYRNLIHGTIVKPLFIKTDYEGNNWICVYINWEEHSSHPEVVFVSAHDIEIINNINENEYFFENEYLLDSWKSFVINIYERYETLWMIK